MAKIYDETRIFDEGCFNAALDFLSEKFPPSKFNKLFEPGIGTGRIAIPLAERGYHITGVDISENMLKILAKKLSLRQLCLPVVFQKADVTALPFPDAAFDIAVATHVFHLIRDWKKAVTEVLRVLKPDAPLVLIFSGGGIEVPFVKDRYRELCLEYGQSAKHIGLTDNAELEEYLTEFGRHTEMVKDEWQWMQRVSIEKSFSQIKAKYYAFTHLVSDAVHRKAIGKLEKELKDRYGTAETAVEVPNQIRLTLVLSD